MLTAFEQACEERRGSGRAAFVRFTFGELADLAAGAGAEWIAKLTTDAAVRGRCLPDRQRMRPPGVPWEAYYAGAFANAPEGSFPEELVEAQKRTEFLVSRIVHAIAHHDFEGARSYSFEERQERENLRRLREKYGISE
jgi:hypothetical protein